MFLQNKRFSKNADLNDLLIINNKSLLTAYARRIGLLTDYFIIWEGTDVDIAL